MNKLFGSVAGQYAVLVGVAVVGFVVIHQLLKKDVTDTAGAVAHPFGQAFDDWFNGLVGGPVTTPQGTTSPIGATRDQVVTPNYVPDISNVLPAAQSSWQ
jgi:hypothetical protein